MKNINKPDGFIHERIIVIPQQIMDNIMINPLINQLYLTDIGYFPKAKNHYRKRKDGCDNYILIFCVDGSGMIETLDQKVILEKNHLYIIKPNTPHIYIADPIKPWSIYWLHFNGTNANVFADMINKNHSPTSITSDKHSYLIKQFNEMYSLLESGYSIDNMIHISCLLSVFLSSINHNYYLNRLSNKIDHNPINQCIEFMLAHVDRQIILKQLAIEVNLSKSYLLHLFKENTGFSPMDYFIHLKIQKACKLLDTTTLSIKEIANTIGYEDPFYFSRIFKKTMALSPLQYRQVKKG